MNENSNHPPVIESSSPAHSPTPVIASSSSASNSPPPPIPPKSGSGSGTAIAALILGILSLVCGGFVVGIPAIILGRMEEKAIREGRSDPAGLGLAKAGWITGMVGTILTCLVSLLYAVILIIALFAEGMK